MRPTANPAALGSPSARPGPAGPLTGVLRPQPPGAPRTPQRRRSGAAAAECPHGAGAGSAGQARARPHPLLTGLSRRPARARTLPPASLLPAVRERARAAAARPERRGSARRGAHPQARPPARHTAAALRRAGGGAARGGTDTQPNQRARTAGGAGRLWSRAAPSGGVPQDGGRGLARWRAGSPQVLPPPLPAERGWAAPGAPCSPPSSAVRP